MSASLALHKEGIYRPDIDGLRAVAVLLVIAFHAFPSYIHHGYIGVDVFFVISGYLITGILLQGRSKNYFSHLTEFYGRRVRRIFPALLIALIVTALAGYMVLLPSEFKSLTSYLIASSAFVTNAVSWISSGYFEKAAETKPLLHLWSLAIEEQFYIFWPLLLLWLSRQTKSIKLQHCILMLFVMSFVFGLFLTYINQPLAYFHPLSRAWELLAGAWLATRTQNLSPSLGAIGVNLVTAIAVATLFFAGVFVGNSGAFPGFWALIPVTSSVLLLAFAPQSWLGKYFLSNPLIVYVGRISYPLYLWHWIVLAFLRIEHPSPSRFLTIGAITISFILASITYHFIERPLQKKPLRRVVPVLTLSMFVLFICSGLDYIFNFSNKRLTPLQISLQSEYDPRPAYRYRSCFLDSSTQESTAFSRNCMVPRDGDKVSILLWGDSLAAQLYPGLSSLQEKQSLVISQLTATSCPPSISSRYPERGHCDEINAASVKIISNLHPDIVVINGRWDDEAEKQITQVVEFLRSNGIKKIILVGPTPDWAPDLRAILSRMNFFGGVLPEYLNAPSDFWSKTLSQTKNLQGIAHALGINFFAPIDILCQDKMCRIKVANTLPDGLVASDHDHLTALASEFLLRDPRATELFTRKE